ncbi:expressed unknown protein [Seminavis robusta]|uniref:MYND-type domain-containing protein n=1 Tax=Seminavis robusta TaxID=568900 RepID=A0A9N8F2W5_9STRA|nr:expressed unknown protein [Seminavis robusta]|eukprot:Sro3834_g351351.1  (110) ;mRNA; r:4079-4408
MAIGAKHKCNFCNQPAPVALWVDKETGELPVACKTCGIRYCSHRCLDKDKFRHVRSCDGLVEAKENLCGVCGLQAELRCSRCKLIHYCCKEHQKVDWRVHKKNCPPSQK